MDGIQEKHERAIGDKFIDWNNRERGAAYAFERRGDIAPDLIYRDGTHELGIEVAECYYDSRDAIAKWGPERGQVGASGSWSGVNGTEAMVEHISKVLVDKCCKAYPSGTLLVLYVEPRATPEAYFQQVARGIRVPASGPFAEIYLTGLFGSTGSSRGGYRCSRLN